MQLESSHLLLSNDVPTASEIQGIQHILAAGRDRIARLQTEISELPTEQAIQELEETKESVRKHAEILSVVRRIPAEIICEIFAWTLPCTGTRRIGRNHTIEQAPWRLGHICQRWRAAALGYSALWSAISLYVSFRDTVCPALMIGTQLRRSGTAPLAVTLDCADCEADDLADSESIDLILPHSRRWKSARLHLCEELVDSCLRFLQPVKVQLPLLRTLEITFAGTGRNLSSVQHIADPFSIAPALREVLLVRADYPPISSLAPTTNLPWSQITHFRGCYQLEKDALQILKIAPNLIEYGMRIVGVAYRANGPHVVVNGLQRLYIYISPRFPSPRSFLNFITAPALQELWVSQEAARSLRDCLQRSSCKLVKLVVYECNYSAAIILIPILEVIPTLTTFFVGFLLGCGNTNLLFNALKITGGSLDICPHLSRIAAGEVPSSELDSFVAMVESRWYKNDPLLSFVRLFYSDSDELDAIPLMDKMKAEGLDVSIDVEFRPSSQKYMSLGRP